MLWRIFLLFHEFQLDLVGRGFDRLGLGGVRCLIFHLYRLCRGAIPVWRVVVHGVVMRRRGRQVAALREFKWLRKRLSECWTVKLKMHECCLVCGFYPERDVKCETERCRGCVRGGMTACQRSCGRSLRNWKPSRVLDVIVHDGHERQGIGLGLSDVDGLWVW